VKATWVEPAMRWGTILLGALLVIGLLAWMLRGGRAGTANVGELPMMAGARVAEIEAALARDASLPPAARPALNDPAASARERARELAGKDPNRAASILKAWMAQEGAAQRSQPHA
jgi:flagellar M-ring protein FliF